MGRIYFGVGCIIAFSIVLSCLDVVGQVESGWGEIVPLYAGEDVTITEIGHYACHMQCLWSGLCECKLEENTLSTSCRGCGGPYGSIAVVANIDPTFDPDSPQYDLPVRLTVDFSYQISAPSDYDAAEIWTTVNLAAFPGKRFDYWPYNSYYFHKSVGDGSPNNPSPSGVISGVGTTLTAETTFGKLWIHPRLIEFNIQAMASGSGYAHAEVTINKVKVDFPPFGEDQTRPFSRFTPPSQPLFAGEMIEFDASESYDPDGEIVLYEWDFGDGTVTTGKVVTHTYEQGGFYNVSLAVVDNHGYSNTSIKGIEVDEIELTAAEATCVALENTTHSFSKEDFTLTFDPYEPSNYTLTFIPPAVSASDTDLLPTGEVAVTVDAGDYGSVLNVPLTVVNPDVTDDSLTGVIDPQKVAEAVDNIDEALDIMEDIVKGATDVNEVFSPCEIDKPSSFQILPDIQIDSSKLCCSEQGVQDKAKMSMAWGADLGGVTCDFPFVGVPYIATLNVTLNAGLGISLNVNGETTCESFKVCGSFDPALTVGGGLSGILIHRAVARAALTLQSNTTTSGNACYDFGKGSAGFCAQVSSLCFEPKLVGEVQLFSLITKKVEAPIGKKACLHDTKFGPGCE